MTIEQVRELTAGEQYDFLRTNPHLGENIILLTLGGSYAYGTNVETSDVDIRGCAMNSSRELLGMSTFEQVVERKTDTVVYGFNKLVSLLIECNPNTIEMLGCKPEHYLYLTDAGQQLLDNRKLFLSQRAAASFGGYATQQLRRLENALARDRMPQAQAEEHVRGALERSLNDFKRKYSDFDCGSIRLFTDESNRDGWDKEIFCDIKIDKYPAREFSIMLNTLSSVLGTYNKINHRNHKKDEAHLNKHAMHLVRLYLMALDIFEKGEINTYRGADRELLMRIRNGAFQNADGTYRPEFFEMVADFEKRLEYAVKNTSVPEHPDFMRIEDLMIAINKKAVLGNVSLSARLGDASFRSSLNEVRGQSSFLEEKIKGKG